jgi:predicted PurR-regulated permease PerM
MPTGRRTNNSVRPGTLIAVVLIIAVLSAAKAVLIPMALAVLLCFLLAPLVIRLQHLGLGRVVSVTVVTVLSFVLLALIGWIVTGQVIELAAQLPRYKDNIRAKVHSFQESKGSWFGRASQGIQEISDEVAESATAPATQAELPVSKELVPSSTPVPVEIAERPPNPLQSVWAMITPLLGPLASAGIVIIFVIFMLIQREDLRDRIIRLIGPGQLTVTTKAIDDAAQRVSRYLVALLIVNVTYGVAVAIGLYFIGLENVVLWGVIAAVVRFIPYVGPWIGASLPILLSLAVFDTWSRPLMVIGWFLVIELVSNNLMEPLLYGSKTGLTPMAILVSAVFWGWLWGPVGLVLATPLTVCLVVLGRYVPSLEFLSVMLGDQPSLETDARVYQRLLAMDQDSVFEIAEEYMKEHSLLEFYERVLIPAMVLAEHDRHHGELEPDRQTFIYQALHDIVENLGERTKRDEIDEERAEGRPARDLPAKYVLCVPAFDDADEIASIMLAQVLETEGVDAQSISADSLANEKMDLVHHRNPDRVCISALPPLAVMHSRYLCKRLTTRFPDLRIIVGLWNVADLDQAKDRIRTCGTPTVVSTFSQAVAEIRG